MINHCTRNLDSAVARYIICSRSNNNIVAVCTLSLNNIRLSCLFNMHIIIAGDPAVAIIVSFIFYPANIDRSCYFIIVVLIPNFVLINISNIMALCILLWYMRNKRKQFKLLIVDNKLEGHLYIIIFLLAGDSIMCKPIELNNKNIICMLNLEPSIGVSFTTANVAFKLVVHHQRLLH